MKKMVEMAADWAFVLMKRSMEMVHAMYTHNRQPAQVRYIGRRLKRGAVSASAVPQTRPQHAMPMLILDLVTLSVTPIKLRISLR